MSKEKRKEEPAEKLKDIKKKKPRRLSGMAIIFLILLVVYVPSFIYWIYNKNIKTSIIQIGTIEESDNAEGYIARDEKVINSNVTGQFIKEVNEGDKVAARSGLVTILQDSSVRLIDELTALDNRILQIEKEKSENQAFFSGDLTKIEDEISQNIKQLALVSDDSSITNLQKYNNKIDELIKKRMEIMGNSGPVDANLETVKKQRNALSSQINSGTSSIITDTAGTVSYYIDGYEDVLDSNAVKTITPDVLDKIKPSAGRQNTLRTSINSGEPIVKVIKNFEYYVVVVLAQDKAEKFKAGDTIQVRINDINRIVDGVVEYKSNPVNGRSTLVLKVDEGMSETTGMRKINVDIIRKYCNGMKIPVKSLKDVNASAMTAKILLDEANYAKTYDVKIVGMNDEYAVINNVEGVQQSGVKLYASYVINPGNIHEGQMIGK